MEIFDSIGNRLREVREKLGKTQSDFAAIAAAAGVPGATRQSQAKYEKGLATPSAAYLAVIAAAGADVNYILTGQRSSAAAAPAPALTPDEREMLALFKSATLTGKAAAIGALQGAAGAAHAPKIHIAGGAHHGQIADVIHNTTTRAPARPRRS